MMSVAANANQLPLSNAVEDAQVLEMITQLIIATTPQEAIIFLNKFASDSFRRHSNVGFNELLQLRRCVHCQENARVTYDDDDDDHTGFLQDTTLCYPKQCWFKQRNLILNRIECKLSRLQPNSSQTFVSHGYSCPCIVPSKRKEITTLKEDVDTYLLFIKKALDRLSKFNRWYENCI